MQQKILIIRFSSIGDIVLTTPVIRCLKKQINPEIHIVVKKKFSDVLNENPYISKVWAVESSISEIMDSLRLEAFDFIIDLHYNFRSILLTWKLRKPFIRFRKLNIEKWLLAKFKINILPQKHLVDRYFDSLQKIGIHSDHEGLDFFMSDEQEHQVVQFSLPQSYIVGVLGATYYTKQIPVNKWNEIVDSINLPLVLIGGNLERPIGAILKETFRNKLIDLTGQLSIVQSAAVIKGSKYVITPDTGMMHIAAALHKPIHVIWGNTVPQFGMFPYFGDKPGLVKYHEVNGLYCRPCTKLGYNKCPKNHFDCMQKQILNNDTLEI